MNDKEIINATRMLAIQYFEAHNKMKELTGDPEEAIRLTNGLFAAIFEGNKPQSDSRGGNFTFTGIGGKKSEKKNKNHTKARGKVILSVFLWMVKRKILKKVYIYKRAWKKWRYAVFCSWTIQFGTIGSTADHS